MSSRAAIFFAPSIESPLWQTGSRWLGRDAHSGESWSTSPLADLPQGEWQQLTRKPRYWGFHAMLKPAFALRSTKTLANLSQRLGSFAETQRAFYAPPLMLGNLGGFFALMFAAACAEIDDLAAACTQEFDGFRQPVLKDDLYLQWQATALSPRQLQLLDCWEYPYLFDEYRFHFTLTDTVAQEERPRLRSLLAPLFSPLCRDPLRVDTLCLFAQATPEQPFALIERYPLGG